MKWIDWCIFIFTLWHMCIPCLFHDISLVPLPISPSVCTLQQLPFGTTYTAFHSDYLQPEHLPTSKRYIKYIHFKIFTLPWHLPAMKLKKTVADIFQWMPLVTWRENKHWFFFYFLGVICRFIINIGLKYTFLFALGNERTRVTCKSCDVRTQSLTWTFLMMSVFRIKYV